MPGNTQKQTTIYTCTRIYFEFPNKRIKKKGRENMSQSNNGFHIFWLVKSYSLIVITVQHFFPPKTCSLQGIVCQTFTEKHWTTTSLIKCNWLRKYNTKTSIIIAKTSEQNLIVALSQERCVV